MVQKKIMVQMKINADCKIKEKISNRLLQKIDIKHGKTFKSF